MDEDTIWPQATNRIDLCQHAVGRVQSYSRLSPRRSRILRAVLIQPCTADNTVAPDLDAVRALAQMQQSGLGRLLVAEGDRQVGIIALKDLLDLFALKMDLEYRD